jgi:MFS transporter, OCT family, solute carrier family 22 (organic cation transporter), member 4/5
VEAPGQVACLIGLKYMGRKTISIVFYVITCVSCLLMIFDNPTMRVSAALLAKLGITSAWNSSWLISIEIYPTVLRSTGRGFTSVVSRIGAITGPFVKDIVRLKDIFKN